MCEKIISANHINILNLTKFGKSNEYNLRANSSSEICKRRRIYKKKKKYPILIKLYFNDYYRVADDADVAIAAEPCLALDLQKNGRFEKAIYE